MCVPTTPAYSKIEVAISPDTVRRKLSPYEVASWFSAAASAGADTRSRDEVAVNALRAWVAGRVVRPSEIAGHDGPRVIFGVADAWWTLSVSANSWPPTLSEGDLVEVEVEQQVNHGGYVVRSWGLHSSGQMRGAGGEWVRLASSGRARALLARDRALQAVRSFFQSEGFLEVMTPSFAPCPGLDSHVHSLAAVHRGQQTDYLITSPELHMKRLVVGGMPRIYQVARAYRAEELGAWHEPEFCLVEWYRAFADYRDVLADTESLVRQVALRISGTLELSRPASTGKHIIELDREFLRITVGDAFAEFAGVADVSQLVEDDEERYFELMVSHVEPALARLESPVFLTDYPARHAALARRSPLDNRFAERFELYAGGVELCNGFGELCDPVEQRLRFEEERKRRGESGEPVYPLDERFLAALEEGLPPAAGNALGLDRLIALASGTPDIATTLAFPDADR